MRYSSTRLLLRRSGAAAGGRKGARPGGRSPGAASRGASDLVLPRRELTALKEADTGGQAELSASSVEAALKGGGGGGGEPCDLVTLVKALPGAASSRGGDEGAGDDEALAGGERALCSATRLTLGGEATSEARRASRAWSRAPVRKATSKVRLAGEV